MKISLGLSISFVIGLIVMPIVIQVFKSLNVLDDPDKRKIHKVGTPSLGGIAIFVALILALLVSLPVNELINFKYLFSGILIIFLLGVSDDLVSLKAKQKLIVQIFAAFLVVYFGNIKLHGFEGLLGITNFGWYFNDIFTIGVFVVMINSYNLIDGIDGLAGSVGIIISLFFAWFFMQTGQLVFAIFSISLFGAILAFLMYNWHPAKIFMGDTGSLTIGFLLMIFMVRFVQTSDSLVSYSFVSPVSICLALFVLPVYDTLRVFIIRFYNGKSPLAPDRNHTHHVLLKLGYNHSKATIILVSFNLLIIAFAFVLQSLGELPIIFIMGLASLSFGFYLDRKLMKKISKRYGKQKFRTTMRVNKSA